MILSYINEYLESGKTEELKSTILQILVNESDQSIRHNIINICGALFEDNKMSWPELLEFAGSLLSEGSTIEQQEVALKIYAIIIPNLSASDINNFLSHLCEIITMGLNSESEELIIASADLTSLLTITFEAPIPDEVMSCFQIMCNVFTPTKDETGKMYMHGFLKRFLYPTLASSALIALFLVINTNLHISYDYNLRFFKEDDGPSISFPPYLYIIVAFLVKDVNDMDAFTHCSHKNKTFIPIIYDTIAQQSVVNEMLLDLDDIVETPLTILDVYKKQMFHPNNYGTLLLSSDGSVFDCLSCIGNIYQKDIYELLNNNLHTSKCSWYMIRRNWNSCKNTSNIF